MMDKDEALSKRERSMEAMHNEPSRRSKDSPWPHSYFTILSLVLYSSPSVVPISDHRAPSLVLCSSPCSVATALLLPCLAVVGG
ncbi:hypothetical protein HN51_067224 [Arachis hypogaea]